MRTDIDFSSLPSPCFIVDERLLTENLKILKSVIDATGCKILLAQKAFSMYSTYPLIGKYLNGTTASSLFEAKLGAEEMGKESHIYSPAYIDADFDEIATICDHIIFNSFGQFHKYKNRLNGAQCGIRVNPEYAEIETDMYNPCFANSRLGVTLSEFEKIDSLDGIDGLHFHTMCEQNSDVLQRTLAVFEEEFGTYLQQVKWINFGGGHHITRSNYDIQTLIDCILHVKNTYGVEVYLEPGEAVALNCGYLVSRVLDIIDNDMQLAIIDTSAACHMPDVLEMPYRPNIIGSGKFDEKPYSYRLGSHTCLAGDVIGDYSFDSPLEIGDTLVFCDMAIYTMVKTNTFNGIGLPTIAKFSEQNGVQILKTFDYEDFKSRL